jgi:hypothetical protein
MSSDNIPGSGTKCLYHLRTSWPVGLGSKAIYTHMPRSHADRQEVDNARPTYHGHTRAKLCPLLMAATSFARRRFSRLPQGRPSTAVPLPVYPADEAERAEEQADEAGVQDDRPWQGERPGGDQKPQAQCQIPPAERSGHCPDGDDGTADRQGADDVMVYARWSVIIEDDRGRHKLDVEHGIDELRPHGSRSPRRGLLSPCKSSGSMAQAPECVPETWQWRNRWRPGPRSVDVATSLKDCNPILAGCMGRPRSSILVVWDWGRDHAAGLTGTTVRSNRVDA